MLLLRRDYFVRYYAEKSGNNYVSSDRISFTDSINKFNVGDVLCLNILQLNQVKLLIQPTTPIQLDTLKK